MPSIIKQQLALVFIAAVIFFANLGVPGLWDEDEPRNAACAREMLARGDWVVPTFNYELRTQKPVLLYWLMMASYSVWGVNEFSARLPSAVLAVGTTLVTFHLGKMLFNARAAFLGGLAMASCLMFGVSGRAATPDSCLVFFTSLSLLAFVWRAARGSAMNRGTLPLRTSDPTGLSAPRVSLRWTDWAIVYAAMALAALAKGPVGVVLPIAAMGLFLVVVNRGAHESAPRWTTALYGFAIRCTRTAWSMRPLTMLAIVAIIAGPWYVLVGLRTDGEWTRTFFGIENLSRFQASMEGHGGPIFYYAAAVLVGFFPWSIVLPAGIWFAVRDALRPSTRDPAYLLLACWAGAWIGVFSLAGTKLPSYVLPAYPALALMSAAFIDRWLASPQCVPRWLMHVAWTSLATVGIGIAVVLPLAARRYLPGAELIGLVGLIPLAGGVLAMALQIRGLPNRSVASLVATAVLFSVAVFAGAAVHIGRRQNSAAMVALAREHLIDGRLATFAHPESSVVYYARRRVEQLLHPQDVARFFEQSGGYLITNSDRWDELQNNLPPGLTVLARQPRFLKEGDVLLVGRPAGTEQTAAASGPSRL